MSKLAHWEHDQFVVRDEFERDGTKVVYREVFSDLSSDSFTQTIYQGESGKELKRALTIHAAKSRERVAVTANARTHLPVSLSAATPTPREFARHDRTHGLSAPARHSWYIRR